MEQFYRRFSLCLLVLLVIEFSYGYFYNEFLLGIPSTLTHFLGDLALVIIFYQQSRVLYYKNVCKGKDEIIAQRLPLEGSDLHL